MSEKTNRQWKLISRPEGRLTRDNFQFNEEPVPALEEGQILVRNILLSLDPANRGWVNEAPSYKDPVGLNEVMHGLAIGVVEESKNAEIPQGSMVSGMINWQDYLISDGKGLAVLPDMPVPATAWLGCLGMVGATAYFGLLDVGQPQEGETLVVSAGAGAVGSLVGQIGKIKGMHVVGIAGSDEKCRWITEDLGFDAAINYKTEDVKDGLKKHCPNGVDVYFDNVGGQILDTVLGRINQNARVIVCGLISMYNATEPVPGPYNFINILTKRARIEGFIVMDYLSRYPEAIGALGMWMQQGKLKYRVDVVDGLENAPETLNKLFDGSNQGKLIIKVSDEP